MVVMKYINKLLNVFLVFIVGLFLASTINLRADSVLLARSIDGASVRTDEPQGLRFYAEVIVSNQSL